MASTDIVTKRIHVGGLTPNITTAHIKDRFKSFGNVLEVEEMKADALGQPRPFTFFTIQTTPSQLVKCLNIMSGSMWRGCQLRLAEAKPKYDVRLAKERNPTQQDIDDRLRKRKRRAETTRAADVGKEAQDMRLPDETNYKTKKFWTIDPSGHLVRPVTLRPTHALAPPLVASTSKTDAKKTDAKKARRNPSTRSNMKILDPSRWQPTHLAEGDLDGSVDYPRSQAGWAYESASEDEEEDAEAGKVLAGRWRRMVDDEEEVEEVWVTKRAVPDLDAEQDENELEMRDSRTQGSRSPSPLFADRGIARSASPMFPVRRGSASPSFGDPALPPVETASSAQSNSEEEDDFPTGFGQTGEPRSRSASPLFANRSSCSTRNAPTPRKVQPKRPIAQPTLADGLTIKPAALDTPLRSPSPLFATRSAPAPLTSNPSPPSSIAIKETKLLDLVYEAARSEKSRDLGLLASFLGEEMPTASRPTRGEWAGFDEDDDEDDELENGPLRIRGGRADEEMDEDSSSESESDVSSSESSNDSDDEDPRVPKSQVSSSFSSKPPPPASISQTEPEAPAAPVKAQSALKAMFAPAPTTSSFSLLGALDADIELDEELDIPLAAPPVRQPIQPAAELQPLAASSKSHFDPDPSIPLFFPSFGRGGKDAMKEDREKDGYTGFWKQETDEEMKEIWERDKGDLTRDWKKRYRDGKKQRKRRGGGQDIE